jgi:hypothetical protein
MYNTIKQKVERNTISASAVRFFEYHADITEKHIEGGKVEIRLELRTDDISVISKHVPRWLRFRRRDPNNPVLMRAVARYLYDLQEFDESIARVGRNHGRVPPEGGNEVYGSAVFGNTSSVIKPTSTVTWIMSTGTR